MAAGRPTEYDPDKFPHQAYVACSEGGFTDLKLAKLFDVCKATITNWKREHPKFLASIKKGKDEFNVAVAENSLLKRVKGFSYNETTKKAFHIKDEDGNIIKTEMRAVKTVRKQVAPDPTSTIFFLKNRDPERWRDKQELEHTGKDGGPIETTTPVETLRRFAFMLRNKEESDQGG